MRELKDAQNHIVNLEKQNTELSNASNNNPCDPYYLTRIDRKSNCYYENYEVEVVATLNGVRNWMDPKIKYGLSKVIKVAAKKSSQEN